MPFEWEPCIMIVCVGVGISALRLFLATGSSWCWWLPRWDRRLS